jgi:hypothetical protein
MAIPDPEAPETLDLDGQTDAIGEDVVDASGEIDF